MSEEIERLVDELKRIRVIVEALLTPSNSLYSPIEHEAALEAHKAELELMSKEEIIEETLSFRNMYLSQKKIIERLERT